MFWEKGRAPLSHKQVIWQIKERQMDFCNSRDFNMLTYVVKFHEGYIVSRLSQPSWLWVQLGVRRGGVCTQGGNQSCALCAFSLSNQGRISFYLFKSLDGKPFKKQSVEAGMEKLLTSLIKFHKISLKYIRADSYNSAISQVEPIFLTFLFGQ